MPVRRPIGRGVSGTSGVSLHKGRREALLRPNALFCTALLMLHGCVSNGASTVAAHPPSTQGHALPVYAIAPRSDASERVSLPETPAPVPLEAGQPKKVQIGLPEVIDSAVLNDPRIRAAFARVLRARADLMRSTAFDNPNLTVSQTLNPFYNSSPFSGTNHQGGPPQFDLGLNYSLERILFGQRRSAMRASELNVEAELAAYSDVARQRVFEAIAAYVDVLQARELAVLVRDEVLQLERLESITARRVALGSVGQVELSRVHIAVMAGRRRGLLGAVELENARSRLRARLGPAFAEHDIEVSDSLDVPPRTAPALPKLLERAFALRPDLLEQERRVVSAQAAHEREKRNALPKLNIGVGYTRQFQQQAINQPNVSSWGASMITSLPFLDRNAGGIATAQASIFEGEANLAALRLEVRTELEQALRSFHASEQILASFDPETMAAATSARSTIEEAYALGGRTLLELLDAQAVYRDAFREHVIARADYLRAVHRLNAIVGEEVFR
ncbi:MAG: Heavy metal efflux outer membrane protein CzcC family [Myxococcaceae bacterium]|nr:Heavy metal efflux outer membrane protein CzcC family [Myxococcaceae bacterium]